MNTIAPTTRYQRLDLTPLQGAFTDFTRFQASLTTRGVHAPIGITLGGLSMSWESQHGPASLTYDAAKQSYSMKAKALCPGKA
jgi:hypothetical protein